MPNLSPHAYNMQALNLRSNEEMMHNDLMATEIQYWPESLQDRVSLAVKDMGISGEVVSQAVADWIAQRPYVFPSVPRVPNYPGESNNGQ